jgi:hypothetical protein
MKAKCLLLEITASALFFITTNLLLGQSWTLTSAPNPATNWTSVAMSADGTKWVAVMGFYAGGIYVSTNSGATWDQTAAPSNTWLSVASSADGSRLIAAASGAPARVPGPIYTSTNYGVSWNQANVPSNLWVSVAASADGSRLVAASTKWSGSPPSTPAPIYISADSGATWISNYFGVVLSYIACSADGNTLAGCGGGLLISTNSGATWTTNGLKAGATAVAVSADAKTLVVGGYGLFTSTNSGTTWETNLASALYSPVACSADGTHLLTVYGGTVYQSSNSGADWATNSIAATPIASVASSADGNTLAATARVGGIWAWHATPAPTLNLMSSSNLILYWLVPSANFALQQNSELNTTNWAKMTNTPLLDLTNLQNVVILPPPTDSCFYRLISTQ